LIGLLAVVLSLVGNVVIPVGGVIQQYFPKPAGYRYTNTLPQSLRLVGDAAEALQLDAPLTSTLGSVGRFLVCYQQAGAADVIFYVHERLDEFGLMAAINAAEAGANFMACVQQSQQTTRANQRGCLQVNAFIDKARQDLIIYAYYANDNPLCRIFSAHLAQYR
jgi:hypothetical protein